MCPFAISYYSILFHAIRFQLQCFLRRPDWGSVSGLPLALCSQETAPAWVVRELCALVQSILSTQVEVLSVATDHDLSQCSQLPKGSFYLNSSWAWMSNSSPPKTISSRVLCPTGQKLLSLWEVEPQVRALLRVVHPCSWETTTVCECMVRCMIIHACMHLYLFVHIFATSLLFLTLCKAICILGVRNIIHPHMQ